MQLLLGQHLGNSKKIMGDNRDSKNNKLMLNPRLSAKSKGWPFHLISQTQAYQISSATPNSPVQWRENRLTAVYYQIRYIPQLMLINQPYPFVFSTLNRVRFASVLKTHNPSSRDSRSTNKTVAEANLSLEYRCDLNMVKCYS